MPATPNTIIGLRGNDLDNLRTFLTCLVIVHHTSNCYGGPGNGPYKSPVTASAYPVSRIPLFLFNAVNQSFFMGLFFWISGRVSAQSIKRTDSDPRRTRLSFVRKKLLRLGLPTVFYTLVLEPATLLVGHGALDLVSVKESLGSYYVELGGVRGPVWYTANLLVFDIVVALVCSSGLWQVASDGDKQDQRLNLPALYVMVRNYGWIVAALSSFLVRIYYPVGTTFTPTGLQVAFAPQYIFAYVMGFASANVELEPTFPRPFARPHSTAGTTPSTIQKAKDKYPTTDDVLQNPLSITAAILLSIILVPLTHIPRFLGKLDTDLQALGSTGIYGGWNSTSFLYALWNEVSFMLIGPAVASHFYKSYRTPTTSRLFRSRDSYGAFMVHLLVSTIVENTVDRFLMWDHPAVVALLDSSIWKSLGLVAMTAVVGMINVVVSFSVARVLLDTVPILRCVI